MIRFEKQEHQYFMDEIKSVGVSELINHFGLSNYDKIPKHILEPAAAFGKAGHLMCKYFFEKRLNEETLHKKLFPYLVGLKKLCIDHEIEPLAIEEPIGFKTLLICGTPDIRCKFDGAEMFLDWKFVKKVQKTTQLQMGGYRYIHNGNIKEPGEEVGPGKIIQLLPNEYKIIDEEFESEDEFENLLNSYWIIKKYGG